MANVIQRFGDWVAGLSKVGELHRNADAIRVTQGYSVADPKILKLFGIDSGVGWSKVRAGGLPAAYACISLIARDLSTLEWGVYTRDDSRRLVSHSVSTLIGRKPDRYLTKSQWMEVMLRNVLGFGDGFAEVVRNGRYEARRLRFWKHDEVSVIEYGNKDISYSTPEKNFVPYEDMIHFKFNSLDGIRGRTPVQVARESMEEAIAMANHGKMFYKTGAKTGGWLKVPSRLEDLPTAVKGATDTRESARERLRDNFTDVSNTGRIPILEQGVDFVPNTMSFGDAQFMQMREMSFLDVCSIFGCPPMLVQRFAEARYATAEQADVGYVKHTLMPYVDQIREELEEKLLSVTDVLRYTIDTDVRKLLKGDVTSMTAMYESMLDRQVMTRNDVRKDMSLGTRDGYDEQYIPAGMMSAKVNEAYYSPGGDKGSGNKGDNVNAE